MDKLNIFVSSTFYDLKDLRRSLGNAITEIGHTPLLHERQGIFYDPQKHTHVSCLEEIENSCDILILVIGARFGGQAVAQVFEYMNIDDLKDKSNFKQFFQENNKYSITQCEFLKAVEKNIPVLAFVEKSILDKKHIYDQAKQEGKIKPEDIPLFDSEKDRKNAAYIFDFIKFITHRIENYSIEPFEEVDNILSYLKSYLSAHYKKLLHKNQRLVVDDEIELIPAKFPTEDIANYFFEDSNRMRATQSVETYIEFDEKGGCKYLAHIKMRPLDKLTYKEFDERVNLLAKGLLEIGIKKGVHLRLNLFFKQPKTDGEFTVLIKLKIENYISDLIDKGKGMLHRSVTNSAKEFDKIHEVIVFPNSPIFNKLKIKIKKHPEESRIGKILRPKIEGDKKIYTIIYKKKDKSNFRKDTRLDMFLNGKAEVI